MLGTLYYPKNPDSLEQWLITEIVGERLWHTVDLQDRKIVGFVCVLGSVRGIFVIYIHIICPFQKEESHFLPC